MIVTAKAKNKAETRKVVQWCEKFAAVACGRLHRGYCTVHFSSAPAYARQEMLEAYEADGIPVISID